MRWRDHLFGETSRANFPQKKKRVRCLLCCALFLSLSHKKRWRRLTRRRTKKREKESKAGFTESALLLHLRLSRVFAKASLCFREAWYSGAFDSSREADARRECWNAEKRIRFLCTTDDDDEDAIFGRMHPRSSSNFDDDDFDDEWCFVFGRYRPERGRWR